MKVLFFRSETRARYLCSTDRFCHKTGKKLLMSLKYCFFLFLTSKITIGSYIRFTLDYCLWRLWKEPRHVSSVVNSRDYVQVRNFRNFCKNFLHLNVSMRKSLDPFFSKPCTQNIKHWWFCFCYLHKLSHSIFFKEL